ncbi:MAG: metal ABC transporter permease [Lachnospiraceae bacterium]|nr:metal ABC transporter permease [Lachnospiraceae bacterium]
MTETLRYYLQYDFVRYALIVGTLIGLCSSLLGVSLVLKRFSFIGDGLSHVAFGAVAIAAVMRVENDMIVVIPVTVLAAVVLLAFSGRTAIRGDAAIAMISVAALAIGYLLLSRYSGSANISADVCSSLFGSTSILTLTGADVGFCIVISAAVIIMFVLLFHKIFAVTFDESFAKATGIRAQTYNGLIAVITALVIVVAMELAGSLLVSALIIFPALSAMRVFKSFLSVTVCAAVVSVVGTLSGILISIFASTPVGASIVAMDLVMFVAFAIVGRARG